MTFIDKLLAYLGFCPSKESAQRFRMRNNTITLKQSVVGVGFILILLAGANIIYAGTVTVDTILRLFSLIVGGIIFVIVVVGGLLARTKEVARDPWFWGRVTFTASFIMVLVWGATTGFLFISPTDGWVEIIAEALAVSLMVAVVEVIGTQVYFRWRKDKTDLRAQ